MKWCMDSNRPLASSKNPHFQNEAKCTTFLVKMSFIYFLNVLYFSSDWLCHFKGLFIPVWRETHRTKILAVTSWQLTNRTVSDISRRSRHSVCQSLFPAWIYNMIQIHSGETSQPPDFVACSLAARPHALKLTSLTFKNLWEVDSL